jgi:hypothetical protein
MGGDEDFIVSYIRYITRAAIASSPSTSPIKSLRAGQAAQESFDTTGAPFDYDLKLYEGIDNTTEAIDPPDIDFRAFGLHPSA